MNLNRRPDGTMVPNARVKSLMAPAQQVAAALGERPTQINPRFMKALRDIRKDEATALGCLLAWHGDDSLPTIASYLEDRRLGADAVRLIGCYGTRASQAVMLENLRIPAVKLMYVKTADRWPLDSLESLLALKPRRGQHAADVFQSLSWRHPDWVAALQPEDVQAAERLLAINPGIDADPGVLAQAIPRCEPAELPDWVNPIRLPRLNLIEDRGAVPVARIPEVIAAIAAHSLPRECFTPSSLGAFVLDLLQQWLSYGGKGDQWVLARQDLGGEANARAVTVATRGFRQRLNRVAVINGIDTLARMRNSTALMGLGEFATQQRYNDLRRRSIEALKQIADEWGITDEELADRAVPDLGLSAAGIRWLDYGQRRFALRLGTDLVPSITDEQGKRYRRLPKPGGNDDPVIALAATADFREFKKLAAAVLATQTKRFEDAMSTRRRWNIAAFQKLIAHPVMRQLMRRLIWTAFVDEQPKVSFRIDDDYQLSDHNEQPVSLPDEARIGLGHPLELPLGELERFAQLFADYEVEPLIEQIGRAVYTSAPEFPDEYVHGGALLGLEPRRWRRCTGDAGGIVAFERQLAGAAIELWIDTEYWFVSDPPPSEPVRRHELVIKGEPQDKVEFSEACRDLAKLPWRSAVL